MKVINIKQIFCFSNNMLIHKMLALLCTHSIINTANSPINTPIFKALFIEKLIFPNTGK